MATNFVQKKEVQEITRGLGADVHKFTGKTILMSGGSGFLGRYFQTFFHHINQTVLKKPCKLISIDNHIGFNVSCSGITYIVGN